MGLRPPHHASGLSLRIYLEELPTRLDRDIRHPADLSLLRHPIGQTPHQWYRNVRLFSIVYAFRPRLRDRLTLSGLTFLRKPWAFGERVSRPFSRYSFRHPHFRFVQQSLSDHLQSTAERSPTSCGPEGPQIRSFGARLKSREFSARNHLTSEQLRTL